MVDLLFDVGLELEVVIFFEINGVVHEENQEISFMFDQILGCEQKLCPSEFSEVFYRFELDFLIDRNGLRFFIDAKCSHLFFSNKVIKNKEFVK